MRASEPAPHPALKALLDEDPQLRLPALWLWTEFWTELRDYCELYESPSCLLSFEQPCSTEARVLYRCNNQERRLMLTYDPDLLYVRYRADNSPFVYELLIKVEDGEARFETRDQHPLTAKQAAIGLLNHLALFR